MDAGGEERRQFPRDPFKVGRGDLTRKIVIHHEAIMNEGYWDSDWSVSNDDVTSKDPKGKKTASIPI